MTDRPAIPAAPPRLRRLLSALALFVLIAAGSMHLLSGPQDAAAARRTPDLQAAQPYCAQSAAHETPPACAAPSTDRDRDGALETIVPHQRNPAPAGGVPTAPTPDQAENQRYPNPGGAR